MVCATFYCRYYRFISSIQTVHHFYTLLLIYDNSIIFILLFDFFFFNWPMWTWWNLIFASQMPFWSMPNLHFITVVKVYYGHHLLLEQKHTIRVVPLNVTPVVYSKKVIPKCFTFYSCWWFLTKGLIWMTGSVAFLQGLIKVNNYLIISSHRLL